MDIAGTALVPAHFHWLVHDGGAQVVRQRASRAMRICGEQVLCHNIELNIFLDTLHHHDIHLLGHLS